jgi:hypothetical protein
LGKKTDHPAGRAVREVFVRKKPMNQGAKLLLQLDRLRKQSEMRKACRGWHEKFWPDNAGDYLKIELAHGTKESHWLRQVPTYWGMATSFVLDDTLSEKAFLTAEFSREMFTMFAKVRPFLKQLRKRTDNPDFMANVERFILKSRSARKRLRLDSQRLAKLRQTRK